MEKLFDETKSGMGRAEYIEVEPNVPPPARECRASLQGKGFPCAADR